MSAVSHNRVTHNRVQVMHGVNFDMLGSRDRLIYGDITYPELEAKIKGFAKDLGLEAAFFQTNHEGEFVEHLHRLPEIADAAIVNAAAWTHYSWAIRDALDLTGIPAVEVHISDISKREEWRQVSVFEGLDLILSRVYGKGPDGYREAMETIAKHLGAKN
jgi:3-dehydroquinate dehydratase-2